MTKTKKPVVPHPFERISEWSVVKHGVNIFINHIQPPLFIDGCSLDIERDDKGNFVGLGIYGQTVMGNGWDCYYWSDWELAKTLLIPKFIAHNGISDIKYLKQWGFNVDESFLLWDTMLIAHVIDSSQRDYGLKAICKREGIGEWPSYREICGKKNEKTLLDFSVEAVSEYNSCDTFFTYKLMEYQKGKLY